jgi:UPF0042 nucleotide-binding protein
VKHLSITIITGLSGSGKSTALAAFEDAGYYCVDNMPVVLLPKFLEIPIQSPSEISGLAFVMDLREKSFIAGYPSVFQWLKEQGYHYQILFLESDREILVQRYSQTRRHHPLSRHQGLSESIQAEMNQLLPLRSVADKIIDTSRYNVHQLKSIIFEIAQKSKQFAPMTISVLSFGFKFGIPHEANLIMDVRFLPNPYFVAELKELSGKEPQVKQYLMNHEETLIFLDKYLNLLDYLIPLHEKEGKAYLTIAVGCTGGRHRSVAMAEAVFDHIRQKQRCVKISHRDIDQ